MRSLILIALVVTSLNSWSQTLTGSWYGIADPEKQGINNNYLTELILRQKGTEVEGVFGYYFRTGYQSYYVRGTFNPKTRQVTIKDIPVTYFKNLDIDGVECPMDLVATLLVSQVKSTLKGSFLTHTKYKYTCPELRVSYSLDINEKNQDSLIRHNSNVKKFWQPRQEELVVNTQDLTPSVQPKTEARTGDTASKVPVSATELAEKEKKAEFAKVKQSFDKRKNLMMDQVEVESDSIRVSFYDNGDIDGDSISVFINKFPVLTHQPLSAKALNLYLALDRNHDSYEISMFAENLGLYPPNTALMIITDGDKTHEVFLSSSLTQNAAVKIKRKSKPN
jgi:hypothetical protein